jgi:CCR4-NOT transcription complex subunit 3
MEKFKAVEKAMKTKAYSKEGLASSAKLDPREQAKLEASEFLSGMVDELEQQIETLEAEGESIQATMKKGKNQNAKAERIAEIERIIERHKWHQGKLELIRRSLENGGVETEQVTDLEESIRFYVTDGMNNDYIEDEGIYDDLNLDEEEDAFGMNQENDKGSSQDTQSVQDDIVIEQEVKPAPSGKARAVTDAAASSGRRPSAQLKSPLPALATLHTPLPTISNGNSSNVAMKPASLPTRPAGEGLKYASAAAAAAASDKNNVGIAPLPPPQNAASVGISPLPPVQAKTSATSSPVVSVVYPAATKETQQAEPRPSPAPPASVPEPTSTSNKTHKIESSKATARAAAGKTPAAAEPTEVPKGEHIDSNLLNMDSLLLTGNSAQHVNGVTNGVKPTRTEPEEESIYHLPSSLQDLVDSYDASRKRPLSATAPSTLRLLQASQQSQPDAFDSEVPRTYRPDARIPPTSSFPQEPLGIFDDPRLYSRIDPDTLFYVFYYKQGTHQQYLAAKSLKDQSWRFHKQYQTWFQRHEEPKNITEEFEQGTYRFFDYESTWYGTH